MLRKTIVMMFIQYLKQSENQAMDVYFEKLKKYDERKVCEQINKLCDSSKFIPAIADIINPFLKVELSVEDEAELKWEEFRQNACRRYPPNMQPWIKKIQLKIGQQKCEEIYTEDLVWLKKEYLEHFRILKEVEGESFNDPLPQISAKTMEFLKNV